MSEPKPAEKFRKAMQHLLTVSKQEILKREADYKKDREAKGKAK